MSKNVNKFFDFDKLDIGIDRKISFAWKFRNSRYVT